MIGYFYRTLASVLSVLYMLLSVGACSVVPEKSEPAAAPAQVVQEEAGPVALTILQSQPAIGRSLQLAAQRYTQIRGGAVEIYVQTVAAPDYRSTMRSKVLAGEAVDLFHILDLHDVAALDGRLADLSDAAWAADAAVAPLTVGERTYGLPHAVQGIGLVYNRAVLEAAGIPLAEVTGFEGLWEALGDLQRAIDDGELQDAYPRLEAVTDLPFQDTDYLTGVVGEVLLAGAFVSREQAYYSPTLRLPEAAGAEGFFTRLIRVSSGRYAWRELFDTGMHRLLEDGLASERTALALTDTECYRRLYAANPDLRGSLQLLPLYLEDWEQGVVFTGTPAFWAVNAGAGEDVQREALAFLEWLYCSEEGAAALAEDFVLLSPYRGAAADTGIALHQQLLRYLEQGLAQPLVTPEAPSGWGESALAAQLREYFTESDKEWAEATAAMTEGWAAARSGGA